MLGAPETVTAAEAMGTGTTPFTLAFCFGPIVLRAMRVAFALAARSASSADVAGVGTFRGAMPKTVSTSGWFAYMMRASCLMADTIAFVVAFVVASAATAFDRAAFAVIEALIVETLL